MDKYYHSRLLWHGHRPRQISNEHRITTILFWLLFFVLTFGSLSYAVPTYTNSLQRTGPVTRGGRKAPQAVVWLNRLTTREINIDSRNTIAAAQSASQNAFGGLSTKNKQLDDGDDEEEEEDPSEESPSSSPSSSGSSGSNSSNGGNEVTTLQASPGPKGSGEGTTGDFDHQAHSVPGGPYSVVDYDEDGEVEVTLNGELSHTHYFVPPSHFGTIVGYKWEKVGGGGGVLGTKAKVVAKFPVGKTVVKLTVTDSQGDVASDTTTVTGLSSSVDGAYCYYYATSSTNLPKGVKTDPKPVQAGKVENINFVSAADFQYGGKHDGTWAARCVTTYDAQGSDSYVFQLSYNGGAELFVDGKSHFKAFSNGGKQTKGTAPLALTPGPHSVEILYYKQAGAPSLAFSVNGAVVPGSSLSYDIGSVLPVIYSLSPTAMNAGGGGQVVISGSGFNQDVSVSIGTAKPTFKQTSDTELIVTAPSQGRAGGKPSASVTVTTSGGISNAKTLSYSDSAPQAVKFTHTTLKNGGGGDFSLNQGSSITLGPDGNFYVGTLSSLVYKLSVNSALTVTSSCSSGLGHKRAVLGLATNPQDSEVKIYASTSTLYWKPVLGPNGWNNGKIDVLTPGCKCLCVGSPLITGLPVTNYDHGVNGLAFLNNGDLIIQVAGFTNAGVNNPSNKVGFLPDGPLSAASLVAATSKGADFNGKITYSQLFDPATADQTGGDVKVRTAGLRNSFGVVVHSNGQVYATDNGPNGGFGDKSTGCNSLEPSVNEKDRILQLPAGGYLGQPNRNRGRTDYQQCVYKAEQFGLKVESSTDGLMEYTANLFGGAMKGDLLATKYALTGSGQVYQVKLGGEGALQSVTPFAAYSGLSVAMGMRGEVVMPRVGQAKIVVLKPDYVPPSAPFVIAVTPRRGKAGAKVIVTGHNLSGVSITFGGKTCEDAVASPDGTQVICTVPPGTGSVGVAAGESGSGENDFIYV